MMSGSTPWLPGREDHPPALVVEEEHRALERGEPAYRFADAVVEGVGVGGGVAQAEQQPHHDVERVASQRLLIGAHRIG